MHGFHDLPARVPSTDGRPHLRDLQSDLRIHLRKHVRHDLRVDLSRHLRLHLRQHLLGDLRNRPVRADLQWLPGSSMPLKAVPPFAG